MVLWCSGYHVCLTRRRSRVRTSPEPRLVLDDMYVSILHVTKWQYGFKSRLNHQIVIYLIYWARINVIQKHSGVLIAVLGLDLKTLNTKTRPMARTFNRHILQWDHLTVVYYSEAIIHNHDLQYYCNIITLNKITVAFVKSICNISLVFVLYLLHYEIKCPKQQGTTI